MDLAFWCLIFWVLTSGGAISLPSPENVTVDCGNFETFVYWNYSGNLVEPLFEVHLKGDIGRSEIFETNRHYRNITGPLNNTSYVVYTIKIRARTQTNRSSFSPSVRFTFDERVKDDATIMCKLDFPPVTMKYTHGELTLSFQNPLHLYENTPALKYLKYNTYPNLKDFSLYYQVTNQNNITEKFHCPYERTTCKQNLNISDEKERYCITLSGVIAKRAIVRAAEFCSALNQRERLSVSGIVILVLFMLIIGAVVGSGVFVFHKKIFKPNPLPSILSELGTEKNGRFIFYPKIDDLSVVQDFTPSETSEDPLLPDHTFGSCRGSADGCRFLIGPGHVSLDKQSQENAELEEVNESNDSETLGGRLPSDYDARQGKLEGMRLGECGEEEETRSEGLAEGLDEVSEHLNQELRDSSGCLSTSGYDSHHCINSLDGEEERYEKGQQIEQELWKSFADYEPRHFSVDGDGDYGDGYATGEVLD